MNQKILLLGGTGAMGVYLRDSLRACGCDIIITSRQPGRDGTGIRYVLGNAHDKTFLQTVISETKPDAIVDFMIYRTEEFKDKLPVLLNGTGQYVFLSSYTVFADSSPLTESSPRLLDIVTDKEFLSQEVYPLFKAREENILRDAKIGNWTIVRPSITYSKTRFQFGCLEANTICYRALHGVPVVIAEPMLDKQTTLTWGGDVARLMARLILNPKAYGEDFNVVTAEHHSWREIADVYKRHIGLSYKAVPLEDYCRMVNPFQARYDRMVNRVMDNSKVLAVTNTAQSDFSSLDDALGMELEAFTKMPRYKSMNPLQHADMDRLLHVRVNLDGFSAEEKRNYRLRYSPLLRVAYFPVRACLKINRLFKGFARDR